MRQRPWRRLVRVTRPVPARPSRRPRRPEPATAPTRPRSVGVTEDPRERVGDAVVLLRVEEVPGESQQPGSGQLASSYGPWPGRRARAASRSAPCTAACNQPSDGSWPRGFRLGGTPVGKAPPPPRPPLPRLDEPSQHQRRERPWLHAEIAEVSDHPSPSHCRSLPSSPCVRRTTAPYAPSSRTPGSTDRRSTTSPALEQSAPAWERRRGPSPDMTRGGESLIGPSPPRGSGERCHLSRCQLQPLVEPQPSQM
ncbi:hypothetical protein QFZ74_004705 [Streptomyces sp. V3I7]|nr:hypothetical protein [Streptomyces sp. V3I7]